MIGTNEIDGQFRPTRDWLVLAPEKGDAMAGDLHLPDTAQGFGRCPVIAAGPDCSLKVGDVVWMRRFVEGEFKFILNGVRVYAMHERHVNVALDAEGHLRAVGDRLLVRRIEKPDRVMDGILIPQTAQEKTQECEVVSVGVKAPAGFTVGDVLLISKYSGAEVMKDGSRLTVLIENDIIGVIEPQAAGVAID